MAANTRIFVPRYISDVNYNPTRVNPHIYFYNGQRECEPWFIEGYSGSATTSSATIVTQSVDTFPQLDYYSKQVPDSSSLSLLFNNEFTPYGTIPSTSLYSEYWSNYVSLLYDPHTRLVACSAIIPLADYFKMNLNDVVEWRGNYYYLRAINDYNTANGECNLQLLGPILDDTLTIIQLTSTTTSTTSTTTSGPTTTSTTSTSTTSTSTTSTSTTTVGPIPIVTDGLVIWNNCGSISGSVWKDLSGNNNDALISGSLPLVLSGSLGVDFVSSSSNPTYLTYPASLVATPSSSFTLQFYGSPKGGVGNMTLFGKSSPSASVYSDGWFTAWNGNTDGTARMYYYNKFTEEVVIPPSVAPATRSLYTFVFNEGNTSPILYVNNDTSASFTSGQIVGFNTASTAPFTFGYDANSGTPNYGAYVGTVNDIIVYNRALTQSEINQNYFYITSQSCVIPTTTTTTSTTSTSTTSTTTGGPTTTTTIAPLECNQYSIATAGSSTYGYVDCYGSFRQIILSNETGYVCASSTPFLLAGVEATITNLGTCTPSTTTSTTSTSTTSTSTTQAPTTTTTTTAGPTTTSTTSTSTTSTTTAVPTTTSTTTSGPTTTTTAGLYCTTYGIIGLGVGATYSYYDCSNVFKTFFIANGYFVAICSSTYPNLISGTPADITDAGQCFITTTSTTSTSTTSTSTTSTTTTTAAPTTTSTTTLTPNINDYRFYIDTRCSSSYVSGSTIVKSLGSAIPMTGSLVNGIFQNGALYFSSSTRTSNLLFNTASTQIITNVSGGLTVIALASKDRNTNYQTLATMYGDATYGTKNFIAQDDVLGTQTGFTVPLGNIGEDGFTASLVSFPEDGEFYFYSNVWNNQSLISSINLSGSMQVAASGNMGPYVTSLNIGDGAGGIATSWNGGVKAFLIYNRALTNYELGLVSSSLSIGAINCNILTTTTTSGPTTTTTSGPTTTSTTTIAPGTCVTYRATNNGGGTTAVTYVNCYNISGSINVGGGTYEQFCAKYNTPQSLGDVTFTILSGCTPAPTTTTSTTSTTTSGPTTTSTSTTSTSTSTSTSTTTSAPTTTSTTTIGWISHTVYNTLETSCDSISSNYTVYTFNHSGPIVNGVFVYSSQSFGSVIADLNAFEIGQTYSFGTDGSGQVFYQFTCPGLTSTTTSTTSTTSTSTTSTSTTSTSTTSTSTTSTTTGGPTTTSTTTIAEWNGYNLFPVYGGTCDRAGDDITAYKYFSGGSIVNGDTLYATQNLGDPLATGYFSDGGFRYEVNTGIVSNKTACPAPPSSTTTTTNACPDPLGITEISASGPSIVPSGSTQNYVLYAAGATPTLGSATLPQTYIITVTGSLAPFTPITWIVSSSLQPKTYPISVTWQGGLSSQNNVGLYGVNCGIYENQYYLGVTTT